MKRVLILALVLAMVGGCAGLGKWSPRVQKIVDFACEPTDAQKAEASKWLTALDSIQAGVSVAFPVAAIIKASSAMTVLAKGGCFILDEIEAALVLLADMQAKQVKMLGLTSTARTSQSQFPVLSATVKAAKK